MRNARTIIVAWLVWALALMPVIADTLGLVTATIPIDADPANVTMRFVPGEARRFEIALTNNGAAFNLSTATVRLITYRNNGYLISSMTLAIKSPATSAIVSGMTAATFITSATYYGAVKITSGTQNAIAGVFLILPPPVNTTY